MSAPLEKFPLSRETDAFARRAAAFAAFVVPAALGILAASPEPYWLDSPELTAAAQTLGMPHPPGHPLFVMLTKAFTLLPFGGVAFRVSVASAVFGALAVFLLFHICLALITSAVPRLSFPAASLLALVASVSVSVTPVWWSQSVRQEVYALEALLLVSAMLPLVRFCLTGGRRDDRILYVAAFFLGLAVCNHPVMGAAFLPAVLPILVALARTKGGLGALQFSFRLVGIALAGLLPYVLLPLRAASGAAVSLGGVHSVSDFFFVLFGTVYQRAMAAQYFDGGGAPPLQNLTISLGEIGVILSVGAVLGCVLLLRTERTRLCGLFLSLCVGVPLLLRAVTGFDLFLPDYRGYLLGAAAAAAAAFSVFLAVSLQALLLRYKQGRAAAVVVAALLLVFPVLKARDTRPNVDLSKFRAERLFSDFCLDRAVPGTLVMPSDYNLFFTLSAGQYIDGNRPDLSVVNPALLRYPGYLNRTLASHPTLAPLARSMLVDGALGESALAGAALRQPLRAEPSLSTDEAALRYLLPDGPLYRASPQPAALSDVEAAFAENDDLLKSFYHLLGTDWQEAETRRAVFGVHVRDALFTARAGDRKGAARAIEAALLLYPDDAEMSALKKLLDEGGRGGVDIAPFLPAGSAPSP